MVPPEEGVDRFIYKEYKETPLIIFPLVSSEITVTESDIVPLRPGGVAVYGNNKPAPEKSMRSDDVLPPPSSLTFGFHGVDTWRQSGNFPVGRANLNTA